MRQSLRPIKTFAETMSIIRTGSGTNIRGVVSPGERVVQTIMGASAPIFAKDTDALDSLNRVENSRKFWLPRDPNNEIAAIRTGDRGTRADRILYEGIEYIVSVVKNWGNFYEIIGVRAEGQSGS